MKVVEIFKSIEGEGKRAGLPTAFVRLAGCNCRCTYCDTTYSFDLATATEMTVDEIVDKCIDMKVPSVTITGGEPLIHRDIDVLLQRLHDTGAFDINVETNGTVDPSVYYDQFDDVWFTIDYKCPSSGEHLTMNPAAFLNMRNKDVLKFVVGCGGDLEYAKQVIDEYRPYCHVYFSPVFGFDAKNIVNFLLDNELYHCKVQLQLHKYIWDVDERGV